MKYFVLLGLLIATGMANAQTSSPEANFQKLSWLQGSWTRTQMKPGRSGTERWEKMSPGHWRGMGVTLRGNDTAVVEKLQLLIKDGNIYYVADVTENKGPVYFKLTIIGANSFTCENPDHDFPKKIVYQYDGTILKATISGDGKAIDYWFKKSVPAPQTGS
jgi:hypothetical protein